MKKDKKGITLSVEIIFIILIATIITILVVMLISSNFFKTQKFLCKLTGTCDENKNDLDDVQEINVTTCDSAKGEIIKHVKLCKEKGDQGKIKETCYVIFLPSDNCGPKRDELYNELLTKHKLNTTVIYNGDKKVIISYNYDKRIVEIK